MTVSVYFARGRKKPEPEVVPWIPFGGTYTSSEEAIRTTPARPLVSLGVRELAKAMIESAWLDLWERREDRPSSWRYQQNAGYRPDPAGARHWFERRHDHAPSFVWCCQVLRLDADAVRERCYRTPCRATRAGAIQQQAPGRTELPQDRRSHVE